MNNNVPALLLLICSAAAVTAFAADAHDIIDKLLKLEQEAMGQYAINSIAAFAGSAGFAGTESVE